MDNRDDIERIRAAVPFPELVERDHGAIPRDFTICCPFHSEKTGSFHIYKDHGHCFGCAEHVDIFGYWRKTRDVDFKEAMKALAEIGGVYIPGLMGDLMPTKRKRLERKYDPPPPPKRSEDPLAAAPHPELRQLRTEEVQQLAAVRGLDPLAIHAAATGPQRKVGFCMWPQYFSSHTGSWHLGKDAAPSWVVTDATRRVLQYRRLDGLDYVMGEKRIKAWTGKGGTAKWPIGTEDIGDRYKVMLVEGGADLLAAYHFLGGFPWPNLSMKKRRSLDGVAPVCLLGCKQRILDEALPFFKGKRVQIFIDADEAKPGKKVANPEPLAEPFDAEGWPIVPDGWAVPSVEGGHVWQEQLRAAGAAVATFSLYGLRTAAGARVGDLNDLALASLETLAREDVSQAFFDWEF